MSYKPEPSVSSIDAIETDSSAVCYFCHYRSTKFAVVYHNMMLRACGPCARGLLKALTAIDKGDER